MTIIRATQYFMKKRLELETEHYDDGRNGAKGPAVEVKVKGELVL